MTTSRLHHKSDRKNKDLPNSALQIDFLAQCLEKSFESHPLIHHKVTIPSLSQMSETYEVSRMDIHEALQILRRKGYDYHLEGMDSPIMLWLE